MPILSPYAVRPQQAVETKTVYGTPEIPVIIDHRRSISGILTQVVLHGPVQSTEDRTYQSW